MQKPFFKGLNSRSSWSDEEDAKLMELVQALGQRNWALIAQELPGRVGKQCRERWRNHLDPSILHDPFSAEEDSTILRLVQEKGTRWARIAEEMPGRTENSIKNRFYCFLKRKADTPAPRAAKKARVNATPPASPALSPPNASVHAASDSDQFMSDCDAKKPAASCMLPPPARRVRTASKVVVRRKPVRSSSSRRLRELCFAPLGALPNEPVTLWGSDLVQSQGCARWTAPQMINVPSETTDSCLWSAARVLCTLRDD